MVDGGKSVHHQCIYVQSLETKQCYKTLKMLLNLLIWEDNGKENGERVNQYRTYHALFIMLSSVNLKTQLYIFHLCIIS